MKKLNEYFFGEEEISTSDKLWFYGTIIAMVVITATVVIPSQIQLWLMK
jgi:hypothetical protein